MRSIALASLVFTGCVVGETTADVTSEVTVATISGTWTNLHPELYQVVSVSFFGQGTFHMAGEDLMDDSGVTHETGGDGFAYVQGNGEIRLDGTGAAPGTLLFPWEESWVAGTHHAHVNDDGTLTISPLQGPPGSQPHGDVTLEPTQVIGPPCNTCN